MITPLSAIYSIIYNKAGDGSFFLVFGSGFSTSMTYFLI